MGTATPDSRHELNYQVSNAQHHGILFQAGLYTPCTGTTQYTSVGDTLTIPGMSAVLNVSFGLAGYDTGPSTNAQHYVWDYTNQTVRWLMTSTGGVIEATTAAAATGTAYYFAVGIGQL